MKIHFTIELTPEDLRAAMDQDFDEFRVKAFERKVKNNAEKILSYCDDLDISEAKSITERSKETLQAAVFADLQKHVDNHEKRVKETLEKVGEQFVQEARKVMYIKPADLNLSGTEPQKEKPKRGRPRTAIKPDIKRDKTCADCGDGFHDYTKTNSRKFCNACVVKRFKAKEARKPRGKYKKQTLPPEPLELTNCLHCGKVFMPNTKTQKCCSIQCTNLYIHNRIAERQHAVN